jgi:hypothetical protein
MPQLVLSPLVLNEWKETRDTLHKYCRMVGAIREVLSQPLPHSLHTNLLINSKGFTTSSLPKNISSPDQTFEVIIDLNHKRLSIESNYREPLFIALTGQSLNALCDETSSLLVDIGVTPPLEKPSILEGMRGCFDTESLTNYWKTVTAINQIMNKIKTELREETSPVQLRPDDLALILTWFGKATKNRAVSFGQQVEFGFSTGDSRIPEAYFYITTYPEAKELNNVPLLEKAYFNKEGFYGMILPYGEVVAGDIPKQMLLHFFKSVLPAFVEPIN